VSAREGAQRHRVVVVGCGFGGLFATKALRRAPVDVLVIDRTNHHLFQPLLYQVSTGILSEGDIAPPIRDILRRQRNADVLLGEVTGIDVQRRLVTVTAPVGRREIEYDSLLVASGSQSSYFGHGEYAEHAPSMKTLSGAIALRTRIFGAFEIAAQESDPDLVRRWMTFVIVGAGPTGVELAGQIAELTHRSLRGNFRHLDPGRARVVLIDAVAEVLPEFPARLRRKAHASLERLGVEVRLGTRVTSVDGDGVDTDASDPAVARIESFVKIWAAGVEATPLGRMLGEATGAAVDRAGRVAVERDCTLPGHPEIFLVGDLMHLAGLPGLAEVAMQSGVHAARTIQRRLEGDDESRPFRYRDLGTMATISRYSAVAAIGPLRAWGIAGWLTWLLVHLTFLTGFKNRVAVVGNWTIAFVGRGRAQRPISSDQVLVPSSVREKQAPPAAGDR
jgi:NADH:quinone reductase (non-electrogenic)